MLPVGLGDSGFLCLAGAQHARICTPRTLNSTLIDDRVEGDSIFHRVRLHRHIHHHYDLRANRSLTLTVVTRSSVLLERPAPYINTRDLVSPSAITSPMVDSPPFIVGESRAESVRDDESEVSSMLFPVYYLLHPANDPEARSSCCFRRLYAAH